MLEPMSGKNFGLMCLESYVQNTIVQTTLKRYQTNEYILCS